ncbi:MAG: hypothetical protein ACSHXF_16285 [Aquaticitalea sp.]
MKNLVIILTCFIGMSFSGKAQMDVDHKEMIGFGCGFAGQESESVQKVSKLIERKYYDAIVKLLDSDNNAERFLAVIVSEKLTELNKLSLKEETKEKILKLYKSNALVSVCSGCTYWDKLSLTKMLQNDHSIRVSSKYWLENILSNE